MNKPDTLFYDGNCPLCMREVRLLTRIADEGLLLTDLHDVPENPDEPSSLERLKNLHLRTADGEWLTGVDATIRAWSHTRWGFFFRPLRWPLLTPLADRAYEYWARRRFDGLYCDSDCVRPEPSTRASESQKPGP